MWMIPLHLHINQKSDYDDDEVRLNIMLKMANLIKQEGHVPH